MDLNTKYLQKLKDENILADIYTDNYNKSDYGFILDFNDDFLLIEKNIHWTESLYFYHLTTLQELT